MEKKPDEIVAGFGVRKTYVGESDWDKTYKNVELKQKVKKVGPGDDEFIIDVVEVVTETDIDQFIQSQADDAGLDAYLKPYVSQGVSIPDVKVDENISDYSGMPEDRDSIVDFASLAMNKFSNLPPELVKGRTFSEFMISLNQKEFDDFFGVKKEEDKPKGKEAE